MRRSPLLHALLVHLLQATAARFTLGVSGVVVNEAGQVLLLEHVFRSRYPWGLPGGWVGRREQPRDALRRELLEETELAVRVGPVLLAQLDGPAAHIETCFLCQAEGELGALNGEILAARWVDPAQLPDTLRPLERQMIEQALSLRNKGLWEPEGDKMQKYKPLLIAGILACACLSACSSGAAAPTATPVPPIPTATPSPPTPVSPAVPDSTASFNDLAHIFDYDPQLPLDIVIHEETAQAPGTGITTGSIRLLDISYASPMGGRVPAYLVLPPGAGPFPALLFMHGNPSSRAQFLPEAITMAEVGAASILIDGPTARPELALPLADDDNIVVRDVQIQAIIDLRRAVDVLLLQPEIDPQQIAFVGHSYGAILGGTLAGVERRITAYVLMTGFPRFSDSMAAEYRSQPLAAALDPIDPIHYVAHAAPSALLFQFGFSDPGIPPELALEYVTAASEPKEARWYHAGHMLNNDAFLDRAAWLAGHLGLDVTPLGLIEEE